MREPERAWSDMGKVVVLLFAFSCCCGPAFGSFIAITPSQFRPGQLLNIAVTAHRTASGPLTVRADLRRSIITVGSDSVVLNPGESKMITIQTPTSDPSIIRDFFVLNVTSTGVDKSGSFSQDKLIRLSLNTSVVLVQTDKAIYRPGQQVRIRVVNVDSSLRPLTKALTVTIVNAKDSKLEQYANVSSQTGVIEKIFQLSDYPSYGTWKILVTDGETLLHTYTFTVEEYVLPRFSVDVKADPEFISQEARGSQSSVIVKAIYTYGKGVQGRCLLTLSNSQTKTTVQKELTESGTVEFTGLDWSLFTSQSLNPVTVTAEVTDETGQTETGVTTIQVYPHSIRLKILDTSTKVLRNGIEAQLFIRLTDLSGNPLGKSEKLDVTVQGSSINAIKLVAEIPSGQTDVIVKYTPIQTAPFSTWDSISAQVSLTSRPEVTDSLQPSLYVSASLFAFTVKPSSQGALRIGQPAEFSVLRNNNKDASTVAYAVIGQGNIMMTGTVNSDKIILTPTQAMCPRAKLLVYVLVGDARPEVVADVVDLMPTGCFTKGVDVSFDAMEARTSSDVNMQVSVNRLDGSNAMPGIHDVYYLAVDKSIVLLQGSTDLNNEKVNSGFSSFDLKDLRTDSGKMEMNTADEIFKSLGTAVVTNAAIEAAQPPPVWIEDGPVFPMAGQAGRPEVDMNVKNKGDTTSNEVPVPTVKVRKDFPDTWLWGHAQTQANGKLSYKVTLPDTITSWLVSAFAINQEGLAVTKAPFELRSFQLFFLTMNLPYSIKRGEIFSLRITVFNYRDRPVDVVVGLAGTDQFKVVGTLIKDDHYEKPVTVPANRAASVEFKINATTLGLIDLKVKATDDKEGQEDWVERKLLVKPEGEERSRAITKAMILESEGSETENFLLSWPEDLIVRDSKRVEVKVTGEVFGQALSNLESLVQVPFGCGEQNMITTVPNIFGLSYIKGTVQQGLQALEDKLKENMKKGYQRQVDNYRHSDGSYSAWGEKGSCRCQAVVKPGSTWLTAFVIKSFALASEYIMVDRDVLKSGLTFLIKRLMNSGDFQELGSVIHQEMQSGTGSGPGLTAYVLISILETAKALKNDPLRDLNSIAFIASRYLREILNLSQLKENRQQFLAAMSAYALSLTHNRDSTTNQFIDGLLQVVIDLGAPWLASKDTGINAKVAANGIVPPEYHPPGSSNLEITAYVLLTYVQLDRLSDGIALMQWLQSQQNSHGGFRSTQDTVMVLQALSEFGIRFRPSAQASKTKVLVTVPGTSQSYNISLEGNRAILLQTIELPPETKQVSISLIGSGRSFAVVKVAYFYYTLAGKDDAVSGDLGLTLTTSTKRLSSSIHEVKTCVGSSSSMKYNGMFVTTLNLPSGEKALEDANTILLNNPKASRVETDEEAIHFYMDEAPGSTGYCFMAQLERQVEFEVQKPGSAKIYPYYEPTNVKEIALALEDSGCVGGNCDSAVMLSMANILLTVVICTLVSLLVCV